MFNVRLRLYKTDASRGAVLETLAFSTSIQESGVATLELTVSEKVSGRIAVPSLVAVEYSTGAAYVQPRNGLFIIDEEAGDSADVAGAFTFTAKAFVPWLMEGMHQRSNPYTGAKSLPAKHSWPDATPGRILRSLIDHGKDVDGWAPTLTTDFTATTDSAGAAWTPAERWSPEFQDLVTIREIFDSHVSNGLIDWWAEGTKLRVFRPGSGTIYPNVKLGGPGFARMPVKQAYKDQFNYLTAVDGDGKYHYFTNPGADTSFGRFHMTMTMSGVKGVDVARLAAPFMLEGRTPQRELSYEWTPVEGMPAPWVDFQVGDGVTARGRDGWTEQRVLGVTVIKSGSDVTVRVTVGSKLLNRLKRAVQKINGGALGALQGGTGVTVPVVPTAPVAAPNTPTGLHVVSNTATWGEDGTARTKIVLGWDAVTQAEDLSDVDGVSYEVAGRLAADASARLTATDALSFTVEGWEPGTARYVKVRALDRLGNASAWSGEISVTPVMPASIVPKAPTGVAVFANVGSYEDTGRAVASVYVRWDRVTLSVDDLPVEIDRYEVVETGTLSDVFVVATVAPDVPFAGGLFPAAANLSFAVRALSTLGVWSDWSESFPVVAASPAVGTLAPVPLVLSSELGGVSARWGGMLAGPVAASSVPGFASVLVESGPSGTGPWTPVGARLTAAGSVAIQSATGAEVWVRGTAFDTLGRPWGTSAPVSIVTAGISVDDIPGLSGDLDEIRFTADGKNRIYASVESPGEGVETRRNLFDDPEPVSITPPNGGVARWFYNGATSAKLVLEPDGWLRVYADAALSDATAMRATGWGGSSRQVEPDTVYTLSIDMQTMPGLSDLRFAWWAYTTSGAAIGGERVVLPTRVEDRVHYTFTTPATAGRIAMVLRRNPQVSWLSGDWYRTRRTRLAPGTDASYFSGDTPASPGKGYRWENTANYSPSIEITSDFAPGDLWFELDPTGESVVAIRVWSGTAWAPQVLYADTVIAAESITAPLIRAGEIEVNHVSPSFGDSLSLAGNGSINLLAGRADAAADQITAHQAELDAQAAQLAAAQAAADAAASGASAAGIAAAAAAAQAAAAQTSADNLALALTVTPVDVRISRPGAPVALHMDNTAISIRRNGVAQTWWDETQMIVPKLKATQVVVGQTVITEGAGRTTWQRL